VLVEAPLKLVIDCGNGAASVGRGAVSELAAKVPLFCSSTGVPESSTGSTRKISSI
jgi:hypothetical protein